MSVLTSGDVPPGQKGLGLPADMLAFAGRSMYPTLREPEMVEIRPYHGQPIRRGDVVVFPGPGPVMIVHRVTAVRPGGLVTRGDNARRADPALVSPAMVLGRVVAAWRGRRRPIGGGFQGYIWHLALRLGSLFSRPALGLARGPYRALIAAGWLSRLLPARMKPRVARFQYRGIAEYRIIFMGRVIGEYDARRPGWRIGRPFRLVVDEAFLPAPEGTDVESAIR